MCGPLLRPEQRRRSSGRFLRFAVLPNPSTAAAVVFFLMLGRSQAGKATGFGPVIRRFESFRPSQIFPYKGQFRCRIKGNSR